MIFGGKEIDSLKNIFMFGNIFKEALSRINNLKTWHISFIQEINATWTKKLTPWAWRTNWT